jgi:hypothetical protein
MYHAVARRQRAACEFPGDALWQAAEISYALGNHARAAGELDQVAEAAKEFGRPNLEVRALLLAGHFHHLARQHDLARARIVVADRHRATRVLQCELRGGERARGDRPDGVERVEDLVGADQEVAVRRELGLVGVPSRWDLLAAEPALPVRTAAKHRRTTLTHIPRPATSEGFEELAAVTRQWLAQQERREVRA